jgi:ribose transport system permease protein
MQRLIGVITLLAGLFSAGILFGGHNDRGGYLFLDNENLAFLARDWSIPAIIAVGEAVVIVAGGIDLSVGAVVAASGMLAVYLMSSAGAGLSPWLAGPLVVAAAALFGTGQGLLITRVRLQPFIVTLAGMLLLRGLASMLNISGRVSFQPEEGALRDSFRQLVGLLPKMWIPWPAVFLAAVAIPATVFLHFTVWGRYLFAIGRNEQAARYSGISVERLQTLTYTLSSALAGISGLLWAANVNGEVTYEAAPGWELWAVAGAVLGGVSLRGGEGTIPGVLMGALAFPLLRKAMGFLRFPSHWEYAFVGIVLLGAVLLDEFIRRREARKGGGRRAG